MALFEIKKINKNGNETSFCPERGGIITSLKLKGKEIFYFDEEAFLNENVSIRGGIPILFPNAGELKENSIFPNLTRHGFARNMKWDFSQTDNSFQEILTSNDQTKLFYPYDFNFIINGGFEDNSFTFNQTVENKNKAGMPISSGLHPYFYVDNANKKDIKFEFPGGVYINDNFNVWSKGGTTIIDNPNCPMVIKIPFIGSIILDVDIKYRKIWIWSLPGKDFICIEPMIGDINGLIDDPFIIQPESSVIFNFKISLE